MAAANFSRDVLEIFYGDDDCYVKTSSGNVSGYGSQIVAKFNNKNFSVSKPTT